MQTLAQRIIDFLDDYGVYNDPDYGSVCIACNKPYKYAGLDTVIVHAEDCELVALMNAAKAEAEKK